MSHTSFFSRALVALFSLILLASMAFGQNLNLNGGTQSLSGTWNVKGNVNNNNASGTYTFSGTVNLNGTTSAQDVGGTTATQPLVFANLNAVGTQIKNQQATVSVNTAFVINSGAAYNVLDNTLNFGGTTAVTSGTFDASNASSIVNYTSGSSQTVLSSTYGGTLGLQGAGAKTLAGDVTTAIVTQAGGSGALTVNNNLTVNGNSASTLTSVADVEATKALTYSGTNTLTIETLTDNTGTIDLTDASGTGVIAFTTAVTNGGGLIRATNNGTLDFNVDVDNTGGTIQLQSTSKATLAGNFTAVGTLTFPTGTFVTFDGAGAQNVPGVSFGTLRTLGATTTKTALAGITVLDAFDNGGIANNAVTFDFSTFTHTLPVLANLDNTAGTVQFGGTANGVLFSTGTVDYNAASGDQVIKGHATNRYSILTLTGGGSKTVADADLDVTTDAGLTVSSGVELVVEGTRSLTVGYTSGDLTLASGSTVTNNGTITVGN